MSVKLIVVVLYNRYAFKPRNRVPCLQHAGGFGSSIVAQISVSSFP
jgi:hypothetical protein